MRPGSLLEDALLGFQIPSFTYPGVPNHRLFERVPGLATAAERSGFDSVYVMDL